MAQYKWIALSNTTLGIMMAMINGTIILISLPAIFRGIDINPLDSFQYLLWILFGYSIVTATLLVTFGRLSDIYGRVRLYNLGFAVFTAASFALWLTPGKGDLAADYIILFRIVQGTGAAFLFSNSTAILTDAFPHTERGKALGINQIAGLAGSLLGLILGGILANFNWRYVFLVSVPFGLFGTVWSYASLREQARPEREQKIDYAGNLSFAAGLTLVLVGITYGLIPYGRSTMGWSSPWVQSSLIAGLGLLLLFPFIETRVRYPMFRLELFRRKAFSAGNFASFLASVARGGVMIMLIILLQGIWLPLHGYSFSSTPFWAGVYMIPMMAGFVTMGPISGWLSDKHGARVLATAGMAIVAASFLLLSLLPYDFAYWEFALIILFQGFGMGMFAAPNTASIMNSVPPEQRGAASGMRATLMNSGQTLSIGFFFIIIIGALSSTLPNALSSALLGAGLPSGDVAAVASIPPTGALFSAFLGYNPILTVLGSVPGLTSSIPHQVLARLASNSWFPTVIAPPFMSALRDAFLISAFLAIAAATASLLRGRIYIYDLENSRNNTAVPVRREMKGDRPVSIKERESDVDSLIGQKGGSS